MPEPTILVLDDVADLVAETVWMLSLVGLQAVGAGSLQEAVAQLDATPSIRVVVCDVRLKRESGTDLLARIAQSPALASRHPHVIFMTGDNARAQALQAGANTTILSKPIDPEILIQHIRRLLGS